MNVVAICNLSISWLAGNPITSIDDQSVEAGLCKANYDVSRDSVLEDGNWTFATKYWELAPLATSPIIGDGKLFKLPAECLRVLEVDNGSDTWKATWAREENNIRISSDIAYIKGIFQLTDSEKFTTSFAQAVAARMAMDLCIPLTNSTQVLQAMVELYREKLLIAKARDGQQGSNKHFTNNQLTVVR